MDRKWFEDPSGFNKKITVPFCPESSLSGIGYTDFIPSVWYSRTFTLPADWKGSRVFLHFGAVDYQCRAWINGIEVGRHWGGTVSFSFEITDALKAGENEIVVLAVDHVRSSVQAAGKQSRRYQSYGVVYTRVTGIWQTVWLEARPESFIERVHIVPDLDESRFVLTPVLERAGRTHTFRAVLSTAEGEEVNTVSAAAVSGSSLFVDVDNPHPWSLEDPYLYDLKFELLEKGKVVDRVESYAGLRKFHIEGNSFYLNNKPLFLRFVLDQGFYPDGIWTAPTDEALKRDIELSMQVGFNGARLHQKVFEERFHYWADKLGYLAWGEYADWGGAHRFGDVEGIHNYQTEWREILMRDRNHPSIVAWTPYNETSGAARENTEAYKRAARETYHLSKALDPTRPVNDASGYVHVITDIYTIHDYGHDPEAFRERYSSVDPNHPSKAWKGHPGQMPDIAVDYQGQPYVIDEYGGTFWTREYTHQPGRPDLVNRRYWGYGKTAKEVEDMIEALTAILLNHPNVAGFTYTQLTDIEQEVNGIYTYDRELKFDAARLKEIFGAPAAIEKRK
jgi:hypothetical protein